MERPPAVLVIEEDAPMRDLLLEQLESGGFEAVAVSGIEEALREVREHEFKALIAEIQQGLGDGFELLAQVHAVLASLPVILMASFDDAELRERAESAGAYAYLSKPFGRRELIDLLRRAVRQEPALTG